MPVLMRMCKHDFLELMEGDFSDPALEFLFEHYGGFDHTERSWVLDATELRENWTEYTSPAELIAAYLRTREKEVVDFIIDNIQKQTSCTRLSNGNILMKNLFRGEL